MPCMELAASVTHPFAATQTPVSLGIWSIFAGLQ